MMYNVYITQERVDTMTKEEIAKKISEFSSLFLSLDENGQDYALTVLRTLEFAQKQKAKETIAETGEKTA
jgi:hypothetical protein